MISLDDVWDAKLDIDLFIRPTRLIYSDYFSELFGKIVYFKPENLQIAGSFKIRGAYLKLLKLLREGFRGKIICVSAGNHAQGVAWAGRKLGFEVTVVMPKFAPAIKIDGVKKLGAKVVLYGENL